MKKGIERQSAYSCHEDGAKKLLRDIVYIALWLFAISSWLGVTMMAYEVPRRILFSLGGCFFLFYLILIRQIDFKKKKLWVPFVIILLFVCGYFGVRLKDYGIQYSFAVILEHAIFALFITLFIDNFSQGKKFIDKKHIALVIAIGFCAVILIIFERASILPLIFVVGSLYITKLNSEDWQDLTVVLSKGCLGAFAILYLVSLIVAPDIYVNGRYIGFFNFPGAAGLTAVVGTISATYLLILSVKEKKKTATVIYAIFLLMSFVAHIKTSHRSSFLGLLIIMLCWFVIFCGKKDGKHIWIRLIVTVVSIIALSYIAWSVMYSKSERIKSLGDGYNEAIQSAGYIDRLAVHMFNEDVETTIFEKGSFLFILDNFTSSRVSLWVEGVRTSSLLPAETFGVYYPTGEYMAHCHNTYICWARRYGWLGALPLIVLSLFLAYAVANRMRKGDRNLLLTFAWVFFTLGFFITEYVAWNRILCPLTLILLYPMLGRFDIKEEKELIVEN